MKKLNLFLFLLLMFFLPSISYSQWVSYYLGSSAYPFDCSFINENTGWAAGGNLQVYKTTNCGNNWNLIYSPSSSDRIESLQFINNYTGWAGTFQSKVVKTTNGGLNWSEYQIDFNKNILSIFFIDENTGWLTGQSGTYRKTTDGGLNWLNASSNYFSTTGNAIYFIDSQKGFACGENYFASTTDGGFNWSCSNYPNVVYNSITFLNNQIGWLAGRRIISGNASGLYIMKSTNSGLNWNVICSDTAEYGFHTFVTGMHFVNNNIGYYSGRHLFAPPPSNMYGLLRKTTNGGINWINISGFYNNYSVETVRFVNQQTGFAFGMHSSLGVIYKTTNGGPLLIEPNPEIIPKEFNLSQNYPNPFNPVTKIKFDIPADLSFQRRLESRNIIMKIYDILGKEVTTLVNEKLKSGSYEVDFNGSNYTSGVYFYELRVGDFSVTKKMLMIK